MKNILFVCHGNICRSPMAEFIFCDKIKKLGIEDEFSVKSVATSTEELGNPVYPPARKILNEMGIDCSKKRAVRITQADYDNADYVICMDRRNLKNIGYAVDIKDGKRISLFKSFIGSDDDISDPWYNGNFERTKAEILECSDALLDKFGYR